MIYSNPILDKEFLENLYSNNDHEVFAKIIALTFEETPVEEIQGKITAGSVNVDGTSAVRRTCSLTMVAQDVNINEFYWGLNTKFRLEVGLRNKIDKNYDDIIWFKQGIYLITSFSTSFTTNNYQISISGKDKMCLLNGDVSGALRASIDFGKEEIYDSKTGQTTYELMPVDYIVREAVHEYAREPWENIIVEIDETPLFVLNYNGRDTMYLLFDATPQNAGEMSNYTFDGNIDVYLEDGGTVKLASLGDNYHYDPRVDLDFDDDGIIEEGTKFRFEVNGPLYTAAKVTRGMTCGYRLTTLTYPGDLISSIGESLTSILDKIVQFLGYYEYFYDLDGRFVFRRQRTWLGKSWNSIKIDEEGKYATSAADTHKTEWNFMGSELVTAFNNAPNLLNLRNDYTIWGTKTGITGNTLPVHLRYAIDTKPRYYKTISGKVYMTEEEAQARARGGQATSNPFRTHAAEGLSGNWWETTDWARRYLYIIDTENAHPMEYYLGLTQEQIVDIIENATEDNAYLYALKTQTLSKFWTKYMPSAQLRDNFTNPDAFNNYPYVFLFDTVVDNITGQERVVYLYHNPYNLSPNNINVAPTSCTHTYTHLIDRHDHQFDYSYFYLPNFPITPRNEASEAAIQELDELDSITICDWREIIYQMAIDYRQHNHDDDFTVNVKMQNGKDINGEWYYPTGYTGYEQYYIDMEGFWRQLYCPENEFYQVPISSYTYEEDPTKYYRRYNRDKTDEHTFDYTDSIYGYVQCTASDKYDIGFKYYLPGPAEEDSPWFSSTISEPEQLYFWIDFLDDGGVLEKYNAHAIGDRTKAVNDNNVKAIYFREVPNVIFTDDLSTLDRRYGYTYVQYPKSMESLFTISSQGKSAIDVLYEQLYNYSYCIESITMTTIPIYHLEPNVRIMVRDDASGIAGEYIMTKLSVPLTYNGTMSITATKAIENIY